MLNKVEQCAFITFGIELRDYRVVKHSLSLDYKVTHTHTHIKSV